jgi:predicted PurR-regulated permease PerM
MIKNDYKNNAIFGIYRLLIISFSIIIIYFAQTLIIPLTIAALLTFLLSPLVIRLEKWIGRIFSILLVVIFVFSVIGSTGYIFVKQFVLFGSNFQKYSEAIQSKIQNFKFQQGGILHRMENIIENLKEALLGDSQAIESGTQVQATGVKVIDLSSNFVSFAESFFGSFFNFLTMTGIVIVLVIFMLFNKEDIRSRIVKLIGNSMISSTTSAINDASERVTKYLYRLFIVNIWFGICVIIGLHLIGIPNPILWGCFAAILRFIPYIGIWIAFIAPIFLSFIISDTWLIPVLTVSFFIILEMFTAYIIEPFYFGRGTGVSPFALIVAAIVWTWLWGPIGLLLSTPLTVCLVVLGQYVTNMNFLRVLLSQEQALTPTEECYHRLLSFDSSKSMEIVESFLQNNSLISLYDSILIPIMVQTEEDFHLELIDSEQREYINQSIREIIDFLGINEKKEITVVLEEKGKILCSPAYAIRDEIGIAILTQILVFETFEVQYIPKLNTNEIFQLIKQENFKAICIGVIAPFSFSKIRFLCAKIHQKSQLPIILCLLGAEADSQTLDKFYSAGATKVFLSFSQAVYALKEMIR